MIFRTLPFEVWAVSEGYDTALAVPPGPLRQYAGRSSACTAGAAQTHILREKMKALARSK